MQKLYLSGSRMAWHERSPPAEICEHWPHSCAMVGCGSHNVHITKSEANAASLFNRSVISAAALIPFGERIRTSKVSFQLADPTRYRITQMGGVKQSVLMDSKYYKHVWTEGPSRRENSARGMPRKEPSDLRGYVDLR